MKRYITAAAFALTAALCCSCSEKKNDGNGSYETLTTAEITTEVQTTATEAAATTTSVTTTATVTERVVTTVKSADELSFTKEDLCALDPAVLCKDSRRRSGEHYEERYSEVSDSYESHLYRFCIDEDAQIAWSTQRDLKDHTMSMETFDYINSAYKVVGRFGGNFSITDTWNFMAVSPIYFIGDVFYNSVPGPAVSEDSDFVITDERYRDDVKVACISGSYTEKTFGRDEESKRYYDKEIDLATGLVVYCRIYDENGKLISVGQYNNLKFGDEAVSPMDQYQFREYLDQNCEPEIPDPNIPVIEDRPIYSVSVLDSEIKRMPEVWKDIMSPDEYAVYNKNGIID